MKTIFVLGAGFSAPAGMPAQADILRNLVRRSSQEIVRDMVSRVFNVFDSDLEEVPLEDIFTALDRARQSHETIGEFKREEIERAYRKLLQSIREEFQRRLLSFDDTSYKAFVEHVIASPLVKKFGATVVTLNWDTILDRLLTLLRNPRDFTLDYGSRVWNIKSPHTETCPSAPAFTIRLLKLHGSLNWLLCTCCGRLYVAGVEGDCHALPNPIEQTCPFCRRADMESLFIPPTLLKDLSTTHLRLIWHSALLELQQVNRLVFIGYSFPLADFDFRYLLLKAIVGNHDIHIRVILYPPDDLLTADQRFIRNETELRYRRFFGKRDLEFKFMDAKTFMDNDLLIWHW